jgi:hypothetical protein
MPTLKPRYTITDTGEASEWLDIAQEAWPGLKRKQAALRLMKTGADELTREVKAEKRRKAIEGLTKFAAAYPPGYLEDLREEWEQ